MKKILFLMSLMSFALIAEVVQFTPSKWQNLKYSKIKSNELKFLKNSMEIKVEESASPLIYPLDKAKSFKFLDVEAQVIGDLKLRSEKQGEKGNDDFALKVGLVLEGDRTLNFFQKAIAAEWVKKLYSFAPEDSGIEHIQFYNYFNDDRLNASERVHPLSDLIKENNIHRIPASGIIRSRVPLDPNKKVLALWISSDGDDTKSSFKVIIKKIQLK